MRLRGCIEDAGTDRTSAVVVGEGQAEYRIDLGVRYAVGRGCSAQMVLPSRV